MLKGLAISALTALLATGAGAATLTNFGDKVVFVGSLDTDDEVDLHDFRFGTGIPLNGIHVRIPSIDGGTLADGTAVPGGGLGVHLTVFHRNRHYAGTFSDDTSTSGGLIGLNYLTVSLMDNSVRWFGYDDTTLDSGFERDGQGNYAGGGGLRHYTVEVTAIPVPGGLALALGGVAALGLVAARRRAA